jgi:hypothetical protein
MQQKKILYAPIKIPIKVLCIKHIYPIFLGYLEDWSSKGFFVCFFLLFWLDSIGIFSNYSFTLYFIEKKNEFTQTFQTFILLFMGRMFCGGNDCISIEWAYIDLVTFRTHAL